MKEGLRKQQAEEQKTMERSKTDHALIEEAMRYGNVLDSWEKRASGSSPSLSFPFGRTPLREYYEFSGTVCEAVQGEILLCTVTTPGITEGASTTCWDLIEVNNGSNKERRVELCSAQSEPQEDRGWEKNSWEDSNLARFSNFLGFSTEGLEKDILTFFFTKIRK